MTALETVAFLGRSPNRVTVLSALAEQPHTREELQGLTDTSRPTIKRILDDLSERGWIVRDSLHNGGPYELVPLGEFVAANFLALLDAMATEAKLRDVADWLPVDVPGFEIGLFADATVTEATPGDPYKPLRRLLGLIEETETTTVRAFGARPAPGYFEALDWNVCEGRTVEVIFPTVVVEAFADAPPAEAVESLANDRLTFRVHDDLPCGLTVLDGHVALCGYDEGTGTLQALVGTDDRAAVEWARGVYEAYRRESGSVDRGGLVSSAELHGVPRTIRAARGANAASASVRTGSNATCERASLARRQPSGRSRVRMKAQ